MGYALHPRNLSEPTQVGPSVVTMVLVGHVIACVALQPAAPEMTYGTSLLYLRYDAIIGNDSQMVARMPGIPYLYLGSYTA